MNSVRQGWLVAARELRERSRSRAFIASMAIMILVVTAALVVPSLLGNNGTTRNVGVTGSTPTELAQTISAQAKAVGTNVKIHFYDTVSSGEAAVRQSHIDVLVVDGQRLEWRGQSDSKLQAVLTGAIQLTAVRQRAAAAGIAPNDLSRLLAQVTVANVQLGSVAGRSPDDETAALIMTMLLFYSITIYGAMVLSGVIEEKSSRVVEVLLARMPARNLLAGKIAGIGLLGLAQILLTGLVALIVVAAVHTVDIPAVRGAVLAWAVAWFVLGYALYATVFGALGSLASRPEDAQAVTGPVTVVMVAGFFVSFAAIGSPTTMWAKLVSYFPLTAPLAMPNRIAMGATAIWEPILAVTITVATIAGLVRAGGRVYTGAVLHAGPTLTLRDAWQRTTTQTEPTPPAGRTPTRPGPTKPRVPTRQVAMATAAHTGHPVFMTVLLFTGIGLGALIAVLTSDVIIGVLWALWSSVSSPS